MTQDEIIEMARQAGAMPSSNPDEYDVLKITDRGLKAFAKLVAAKEREACAKVCEAQEDKGGEWDIQQQCANAIRARGEA